MQQVRRCKEETRRVHRWKGNQALRFRVSYSYVQTSVTCEPPLTVAVGDVNGIDVDAILEPAFALLDGDLVARHMALLHETVVGEGPVMRLLSGGREEERAEKDEPVLQAVRPPPALRRPVEEFVPEVDRDPIVGIAKKRLLELVVLLLLPFLLEEVLDRSAALEELVAVTPVRERAISAERYVQQMLTELAKRAGKMEKGMRKRVNEGRTHQIESGVYARATCERRGIRMLEEEQGDEENAPSSHPSARSSKKKRVSTCSVQSQEDSAHRVP
jgi:hypothetical protein